MLWTEKVAVVIVHLYLHLDNVATSWSTSHGSLYSNTDGKLYTEKRTPFAEIIVNPD
jgi:hypothetical protein